MSCRTMTRLGGLVCCLLLLAAADGYSEEITLPEGAETAAESPLLVPQSASADDSPDTFREQTIYIPFNKLREVFEKPGRGVFVPYEQFRKLWEQARSTIPDPAEHKSPSGAFLREATSEATVEGEVVVVASEVRMELLGRGWHTADLRLPGAAIRSATINGQPARLLFESGLGHKLLIENELGDSREVVVLLEYAKAVSKSAAQHSVTFQPPQAPVNRWRFCVPAAGVSVRIHPRIAAQEGDDESTGAEETILTAFVGAAPEVRIDWTPKAEGATGLEALTSVQAEQEVTIGDGVVRTKARLDYEIRRAEVAEFLIQVPESQRVTGVFDANVRQWQVRTDGSEQIVSVQLFQPAKGRQTLTVELEKFVGPETTQLEIPAVKAMSAGRQQGIVVVRVEPQLRADVVSRQGLSQLDTDELPQRLKRREWDFGYRYSLVPFELALQIHPVTSRVFVDQLSEAYLESDQLSLETLLLFDVQRTGLFEFSLRVPLALEVRAVRGVAVGGAEAVAVDSFRRDPAEPQRLTIDLSKKAEGRVALVVELHRSLTEPGLADADEEAAELALELPTCLTPTAQLNGSLVLFAPESLRANPGQLVGLKSVSFADANASLPSQRGGRHPDLQPVLAYAHQAGAVELQLNAKLRKPQVTVSQLLSTRVESGVTKYAAKFFYDIRYSGVETLRIDVPLALAADIRNVTSGVRQAELDPQPADVADGNVAWGFTGESPFLGSNTIQLEWDLKSEELQVGASYEFAMPSLVPRGVDRAWGQIVLSKAESLDIQPGKVIEGLRSIDPQHDLMPAATGTDAIRAFEFHDQWSLTVLAKRYELEDVKRTSIEKGVVRMVVTRSGRVSVQALYRLRSVTQGLVVKLPADAEFDADPLWINGRAAPLKQGEADTLFVPLNDREGDSFLLDLRYTIPGSHRRLDLPEFPAQPPLQTEPAVQKVLLTVYLPEEMIQLGSLGPWTPLSSGSSGQYRNRVMPRPESHIEWLLAGMKGSGKLVQDFPLDGRPYTFAALRPAPPPDGSLRLIALSTRGFNLVLFGCVGLLGVAVARQSVQIKLACGLTVALAVVVIGIFAPTFADRLMHERLLIAGCVLVMIWLVAGATRLRLPWQRTPEPAPSQPVQFSPVDDPQTAAPDSAAGDAGNKEVDDEL